MTYGIFDSGEGGHNLLRYARMRNREDDIIFLCDRARAPYGTKRDFELAGIVSDNVRTLKRLGAEKIVIACCTACTVYNRISDRDDVFPILSLAAERARTASVGKIAVLATGATVRSGEFSRHLKGRDVVEIEAQPLVRMIDGGAGDESPTKELTEYLDELICRANGCDTVILGCTHFSSVKRLVSELGMRRGIVQIIDAAQVGAALIRQTHSATGGIDFIFNTKNTDVSFPV